MILGFLTLHKLIHAIKEMNLTNDYANVISVKNGYSVSLLYSYFTGC